jgi:NTE family protein
MQLDYSCLEQYLIVMQNKKLKAENFLTRPVIQSVKKRAEKFRLSGIQVSDIIDETDNQYVDLVQEGGGVLGIALIGYTWAMEEAGIRFFSLAGTSAGAINTLLIASKGDISLPKSLRILEELCDQNLFEFVDGKKQIRSIIKSAIDNKIIWSLIHGTFHLLGIIGILKKKHGLNPGNTFQHWIENILEKDGISSNAELLELRNRLPEGFRHRIENNIDVLIPKLVIVASEITTQTKVHFPEMADLYFKNPGLTNPSEFVRASMSIPLFFEPYKVTGIPVGQNAVNLWRSKVKFEGDPPDSVVFVDGGMISNFPINVFHNPDRVPRLPTFGVRLSAFREKLNNTSRLNGYFGAMLKTMRHIYDFDFLLKNPDYSQLICRLDTDNDFSWLDFNMSDENKLLLFEKGASGAIDFLENFNWGGYKELRRQLLANK